MLCIFYECISPLGNLAQSNPGNKEPPFMKRLSFGMPTLNPNCKP